MHYHNSNRIIELDVWWLFHTGYDSNKGSGGHESEHSDSDQDLSSDCDSVSSCPKQ